MQLCGNCDVSELCVRRRKSITHVNAFMPSHTILQWKRPCGSTVGVDLLKKSYSLEPDHQPPPQTHRRAPEDHLI